MGLTDPLGLSAEERAVWGAYIEWIKSWYMDNPDRAFHDGTIQMLNDLIMYDRWAEYEWNDNKGPTKQQMYNYDRAQELREKLGERKVSLPGIDTTNVGKVRDLLRDQDLKWRSPLGEGTSVQTKDYKPPGLHKTPYELERPGGDAFLDWATAIVTGITSNMTKKAIVRGEPGEKLDRDDMAIANAQAIAWQIQQPGGDKLRYLTPRVERATARVNGPAVLASGLRMGMSSLREGFDGLSKITFWYWTIEKVYSIPVGTYTECKGFYIDVPGTTDYDVTRELGEKAMQNWFRIDLRGR